MDILIKYCGGTLGDFVAYYDNETSGDYSDDRLTKTFDDLTDSVVISDSAFVQLGKDDYLTMGLDDYASSVDFPPIYLLKAPNYKNPSEKIYLLKSPKYIKKDGIYQEEDYLYYQYRTFSEEVKSNYKMEFDEQKGVNRPLLTENMIPVKNYFAENDFDRYNPVYVEDVYKDDWYNYSKNSPMWANVMMKNTQDSYSIANRFYVWIPRFAYKIQDFYKGVDYSDIPSTAIDIVFLREDTDYMANDEVLATGYQVHPAFKYQDERGDMVNIPGFWVAKDYIATCDGVISATSGKSALDLVDINYIHPGQFEDYDINMGIVQSRLIKNTEWAALAYLSLYTVGRTTNGNSLGNNPSGVVGLNVDVGNIVAGGFYDSNIAYMDKYEIITSTYDLDGITPANESAQTSRERLTYYSYETNNENSNRAYEWNNTERKFGDAVLITSTLGSGDHNSWFEGYSEKITTSEPFFIRGDETGNMFSYRATSNSASLHPAVRNVLIIKGQ